MSGISSPVHRLSVFALPAGTPPGLRAAYRVLLPAAAALWGLSVAGIWEMPLIALIVIVAAASVTAICGFACWVLGIISADGRCELIRLSADLYQRIPEGNRPPLVQSAR